MVVCGLFLAAALGGGVVRLFALRFARGDVYPPYSTLRSDPLGASALYESLDRVPGLSARRYFERTFKENDGRGRTLMILGLEPGAPGELPRPEFATLQQFVLNGGRIVMAWLPEVRETRTERQPSSAAAAEKKAETKADDPKPPKKDDAPAKPKPVAGDKARPEDPSPGDKPDNDWRGLVQYASPPVEWGYQFKFQNLSTNDEGGVQFPAARPVGSTDGLPPRLTIHTALYFAGLTNGWTTMYARDQLPVVVERRLGKGSVLLVADAYFFSNEALLKNREAGLLAWVIGGGREVIFDEAHLGVQTDPGVASLLRQYHLHGLFFSLLLLAGLFVWKNASSLVPPHETPAGGAPGVTGRDAMTGLVNLLRRGIPRTEILNRIFEEWRKTRQRSTLKRALWPAIETLIREENARPPRQRQPVATYRAISALWQRRH
jgi:hypothetical protein